MEIKKANKFDLPEILQLQYLAYKSEAQLFDNFDIPPLNQTLKEIEAELNNGLMLKVLDENNNIIASIRGNVKNDTLYIGKLIVHPDMQGQGIGTALLKEIERICKQKRYELLQVQKV